ncbi:type II CRISPR RNA-guided endonuclease Cas9 [Helicobacter japonicus]|uniref:type II CRISPR RNA-guided endonuclease Cas9 n=1 Tax=Helicobacter japonicus TaxID=425400 RepID=UPI0023F24ADA|nr:type II CRISPR RNA-guided endonuclease Cas9 [Helicobacter japonicus]
MMKILGFDIGITSIGWAFVEGEELRDCGVRIFTKAENPKNGDSLAAPRREARSTRRRLARRKARLNAIKRLLCKEFGLNLSDYFANDGELPKAYETTKDTKSPYELRTLALEQKLEPKELARVILHIAKHRGYGNKHAKTGGDKDSGKVLSAIKTNEATMNAKNYKSVGEYLYKEFYQKLRLESEKKGNNTTKEFKNVRNKGENYEHCVAQEQVRAELELIFKKQKDFGATFSENFESQILETAFYQRDLKSFEDKVGKCVFYENENRAPKDSLSAMEFVALTRIINTLKNLEEKSKNLGIGETKDKIQEILKIVLDKGEMSYKKLRDILRLDMLSSADSKLDEKVKFIEPKRLKNLKDFRKAMGGDFSKFDREELDKIATDITLIKSKENLAKKLQDYPALSKEQVEALSNLSFSQHINLSLKALYEILPFMREGLRYDKAVQEAGLQEHRKHKQKGKFLIPLKEYEPYLANPVVARALSEYRKVLNALLRKYGAVHKIHLEFTREAKLSVKERQKYEKEQREHFEANEEARKRCEDFGLEANGTNILKLKLWQEQKGVCIYSEQNITRGHLLDSNALQIDHIYPYSRSFDDSYMNKVLVFSKENQNKLNKTPFEAFGEDKKKWDRILSLSAKLPKQKQRRISNTNFKGKEGGFLARNLNDTGYIARLASQWSKDCLEFLPLSENEVSIAGEKGSSVHIEVVSGSLTTTLRHYWGLGSKNRDNHLHHAVDAIILAYTNAKTIKAFADFRKNQEQNKAKFYAKEIAESEYKAKRAFFEPCKNFRQRVEEKIKEIFVSKPPRKRVRGALHQETFYPFEKLCNDKEYSEKLKMDYGGEKGMQKAIALGKIRQIGTKIVKNGAMVRVDIFKDKKGKFYGVPIYTMDFALGILPNKAVVSTPTDYKKQYQTIKDWIEMDSNYSFCFSLFKDDLILVQKKEMRQAERCYFVSFDASTASIQVEKHNNKFEGLSENEKILYSNATQKEVAGKSIGIQNLKTFEKYQVSPLGEAHKAEFESRQEIKLKSSPKRKG